jgi:hypothetical protein
MCNTNSKLIETKVLHFARYALAATENNGNVSANNGWPGKWGFDSHSFFGKFASIENRSI